MCIVSMCLLANPTKPPKVEYSKHQPCTNRTRIHIPCRILSHFHLEHVVYINYTFVMYIINENIWFPSLRLWRSLVSPDNVGARRRRPVDVQGVATRIVGGFVLGVVPFVSTQWLYYLPSNWHDIAPETLGLEDEFPFGHTFWTMLVSGMAYDSTWYHIIPLDLPIFHSNAISAFGYVGNHAKVWIMQVNWLVRKNRHPQYLRGYKPFEIEDPLSDL